LFAPYYYYSFDPKDAAVRYWLNEGAPAAKLILGMPLYGRGFTLDDPEDNGIGAPAHQPSIAGPYTHEAGVLSFNEICEKFKNETWHVIYNEEVQVPYAYNNNQWISYDNER
jgi:chitinase